MEKTNQTISHKARGAAKDFFLHLGFIAALYTFVVTYVTFLFAVINSLFPDRQYNYYDPYGTGMRFSVSMLIVVTPLLIYLGKKIHDLIIAEPSKDDSVIRRWGLYLTLFISILALAIDLVVLINTFLGGEITTRFTLKALSVLVISGMVWQYTRLELANAIASRPKLRKGLRWGVSLVVLISIVGGFLLIGSPSLMRDVRDDNLRESHVNDIKYQVFNYYQSKNGALPQTLDEVNVGNIYDQNMPVDPKTQQPYEYRVLESKVVNGVSFPAFAICATFAQDGKVDERVQNAGAGRGIAMPAYDTSYYPGGELRTDDHPAGYHCFEFSIDPQRYKPMNSPEFRGM